jgi:uncharacterized membrane protein
MKLFISNLIGNEYLATLIMSFFPLIELKGAIIYAWDSLGFIIAFLIAYFGSTIIAFPVFFLLKPILNLLKKIKFFNKFALKIEGYFERKAQETLEKRHQNGLKKADHGTFIKKLGVFIFVAIPLPMTGVWTGTAIAVFLGLKFKDFILPITLGNLIAGLLVSGLSYLCTVLSINLDTALWILFALAGVLLILTIVKISLSKPKNADKNEQNADIK